MPACYKWEVGQLPIILFNKTYLVRPFEVVSGYVVTEDQSEVNGDVTDLQPPHRTGILDQGSFRVGRNIRVKLPRNQLLSWTTAGIWLPGAEIIL
jgi:hypothetical protein